MYKYMSIYIHIYICKQIYCILRNHRERARYILYVLQSGSCASISRKKKRRHAPRRWSLSLAVSLCLSVSVISSVSSTNPYPSRLPIDTCPACAGETSR